MNNPARTDDGNTTDVSRRSDRYLRVIVTLLVLIFPAATLYINRGDSYTLGSLAIIGIWVWLRDGARVWLNRDSGYLCLTFVLFFAVVVLAYLTGYQTEDGFHYLGRYLRFLFVVPAYLAFRRYPPTAKTVFIGLALGALTAGILASLEFAHAHGSVRVAAQTDLSIIFGDLATTMVLCMVAGFGLMAVSRRRWSVPLLILCLASGVTATLLSGTRGAWLPLFLLIPVLATPAAGFLKHRYLFAILAVIIAVFSSSYLIARTDTQGRLKDAYRGIQDYFIALHSLKDEDIGMPLKSRCDNQNAFLEAWLHYYSADNHVPAGAEVIEDPLIENRGLCRYNYVVRLYDPDPVKWAEYIFPRMPQTDIQSSQILARGNGILILNQTKQGHINISSSRYTHLALEAPGWTGATIRVYVLPRETVWVVPMDGYAGEYSLSIADTSVGKRLEMWRAAWRLFLSHPVLGVGTGAYQAKTSELIQHGKVAPFIGTYDHPHDDYLDALASRGILGFVVLLGIFLIPAIRFLRATRSPERATHAVGLAGMLTVAGFAIYALTDTIFLHSIMISWYVIYMALFYSLLDASASLQSNQESMG